MIAAADRLYPGGVIDVGYRGYSASRCPHDRQKIASTHPLVGQQKPMLDGGNEQHVRAFPVEFEIISDSLGEYGGGEWSERLAIFDLQVQCCLRLRVSCISED